MIVTGFQAQFDRRFVGGSTSLEASWTGREGVVEGRGMRIACRPRALTLEAAGRQPLVTPGLVAVLAGHIDNRVELARRLGLPAAAAADVELVANAYARWGSEGLLVRLVGEFSFVILDRRDGRVLGGRDGLGVGRLYLHDDGNVVTLASSLAGLLGSLEQIPPLDRDALVGYLGGRGFFVRDETPYAGVRGVPAAHVVEMSGRRVRVRRDWSPDPERRIAYRSSGQYDEQLRSLLFEAVGAAIDAPGTILTDVSGGLDSSTVACVAARAMESDRDRTGKIIAFSFTSRIPGFDRPAFVEAVVERCGFERRTVDLDEHLPWMAIDDELLVLPDRHLFAGAAKRALAQIAHEVNGAVWLCGEGGDQLFWGTPVPLYLAHYLRSGDLRAWSREMRGLSQRARFSIAKLLRISLASRYPGDDRHDAAPPWMDPHLFARLREIMQRDDTGWVTKSSSLAWNVQFNRLLRAPLQVPRRPAACEVRFPLLYRPLVEFMLAIPWDQKATAHQTRVVQRRALRGIVPDVILSRNDKADFAAFRVKGLALYASRARRYFEATHLAQLGLVTDPTLFRDACERFRHGFGGRFTHHALLVAALSLEAWLELRPMSAKAFDVPLRCGAPLRGGASDALPDNALVEHARASSLAKAPLEIAVPLKSTTPDRPLRKRPGVYLVPLEDEGVLFDLPNNRYLALGAMSTRLWSALDDEVDERRLLFAIQDAEPDVESARQLVRTQIELWRGEDLLVDANSTDGRDLPRPRRSPGGQTGLDTSWLESARPTPRTATAVVRSMLWVRWYLRRRPLPWLLAHLQNIPVVDPAIPGSLNAVIVSTTRLHGVLRRAVHVGTDDCLPASLSLGRALRQQGVDARVCFGVQKFPFLAHAWVEADRMIVNDSVENISRFTTIASF
jgi:asparagine synthase (glutamine-hydrolysing)